MKKLLFLLAMTLVSVSIIASTFEVDGICYEILSSTDKAVSVTSKGNQTYSGDIVIPEKVIYNGKTYSVTSIGYRAFKGCNGLSSIDIPNSVSSIGKNAFSYCSSLKTMIIPDNVTSIGEYAFEFCDSLSTILIGNNVTSIGGSAFKNCRSLASLIIPNSVTYIGGGAFSGCI